MRKLLFITTLLAGVCSMQAQTTFEEIKENPNKAGGIYLAYPVSESMNTNPPKGYEPFYISHYGRHGSRYLIGDNDYKWLIDLFDKAESAGALTPLGRSVAQRLDSVWVEAEGRGGDLTPLGARQHKGIAQRMYDSFPRVFADNAEITARSTVVLRCALSMAAFCEGLKERKPSLEICKESSNRYMNYLNWHSDESNYYTRRDGDWAEENRKFRNEMTQPDRLTSSLFASKDFVRKNVNPDDLMWGLYWVAVDMQNVETPVSFMDIFTPEELFSLWQSHNFSFYATNSNPPAANGLLLSNSKPQLRNILESARQKISHGKHGADLRFGHDGNLIPLVGLLNMHNCHASEADPYKLYQSYSDFKISPMAGNLQIVFFRPKDVKKRAADNSDVLVKFMLNERETAIDALTPVEGPFYSWSDVESFWESLLTD